MKFLRPWQVAKDCRWIAGINWDEQRSNKETKAGGTRIFDRIYGINGIEMVEWKLRIMDVKEKTRLRCLRAWGTVC
jgi:hypothetical protein